MAKRPTRTTTPKEPEAPTAPSPAPKDHNKQKSALSRADRTKLRLSHIQQMRPHMAKIEELKSAMKAERKLLNVIRDAYANDGFSLSALDERLRNEGKPRKVVQAYETERHEVGEDLGQATYVQPDLFEAMPEAARDEEYWRESGYQLGIEGKEPKAPKEMPTQFHQAFMKGWHAAQERLAWAMAPAVNPEQKPELDPLLQ